MYLSIENAGAANNMVSGNPFGGAGEEKDPYMDTNLEDFDIDEDLIQIKMTNQEIVMNKKTFQNTFLYLFLLLLLFLQKKTIFLT